MRCESTQTESNTVSELQQLNTAQYDARSTRHPFHCVSMHLKAAFGCLPRLPTRIGTTLQESIPSIPQTSLFLLPPFFPNPLPHFTILHAATTIALLASAHHRQDTSRKSTSKHKSNLAELQASRQTSEPLSAHTIFQAGAS